MAEDKELTTPLLSSNSVQISQPSYSVTRARIAIMLVPMLYFACLIPSGSLLPQYLVYRLNMENRNVSDNITQHGTCDEDVNQTSNSRADAIQSQASDISLYLGYAGSIPSFFGCLLLGGFADIFGRRPLLLLAIFTGLIRMLGITLTIAFNLPLWVLYLVHAIDGMSGSWVIMFVALMATIADVSSGKEGRVFWIAVLNCCISVISAVFTILDGLLIGALGFLAASILCVGAIAASFLVTLILLPETGILPDRKTFNAIANVHRIVGYFLSQGSTRRRLTFWLCILLFMFAVMNTMSITTIDTLYQIHRPFCWDPFFVGLYSGLRQGGQYTAGAIILKFFSRFVRGEYLGMAGLLCQAASFAFEAFIKESWQFILVPIIGTLGATSISVIRGCMSLLAPATDQATVFSSVAVTEVVCNLIATTGVMRVYSMTVTTFPGANYLLNAGFSFIAFLIFIVFLIVRKDHYEIYERIDAPINDDNPDNVQ